MSVGPSEVVVIVLIAFLLFGSRRLADLGKGIGEGIRGFRRGIAGESDSAKPENNAVASMQPKADSTQRVAVAPDAPADPVTAAGVAPTSQANAQEPAAKSSPGAA